MLTVTENARRHLKRLLMSNTGDPDLGIRLTADKGMRFGVLIDRKADDDYVIEYEGMKVLMVEAELLPLVDGAILDTEKNNTAANLIITKGDQQLMRKERRYSACQLK